MNIVLNVSAFIAPILGEAGRMFQTSTAKIGASLVNFRRDNKANIVVIFALLSAPVVSLVGLAVDYGHMASIRTKTQMALDAAALSVARDAGTLSAEQLNSAANREFMANLGRHRGARFEPIVVTRDNVRVTLAIGGEVDTTLGRASGTSKLNFNVTSAVVWRQSRIELTLVLDNTGSMEDYGKMTALRQATRDMLRDLEAIRTFREQIRVAIVPFDTQVNIGREYQDANWIRFDDQGLSTNLALGNHWREEDESRNRDNWTGCLTDRDQPHDVSDALPISDNSRYRASRCLTGSLAMTRRLTDDLSSLRPTVDSMTPSGATNITIGLQVGLAIASPSQPWQDTYTGPDDVQRFMILMTDGDNTQNRFFRNSAAIDARTRLACRAVKDAGIRLFTVRVINGNSTLLRECASRSDMYYSVEGASGISAAFKSITGTISRLRLVR